MEDVIADLRRGNLRNQGELDQLAARIEQQNEKLRLAMKVLQTLNSEGRLRSDNPIIHASLRDALRELGL